MRPAGPGLKRASQLFRKQKYSEVVRILEPQVFNNRDNARYYYLLGISCLMCGDVGGAYSYLKRSNQLDLDDADTACALAAAHVRRGETNEAIRLWLGVLDENPGNRTARRALGVVKRSDDPDALRESLDGAAIERILPGFRPLRMLVVVAAALPILALVAGVFIFFLRQQPSPGILRPGFPAIMAEGDRETIEPGQEFRYTLSEHEVISTLRSIEKHLNDFDDNAARREINRLLHSNASQTIRNRVKLVLPHLQSPDFTNFSTNYTFSEVRADPILHEGCYVRWSGRVSNITVTADRISFDFLVGYVDPAVLEGVLRAEMDFAARIDPAFAYEIIARIERSDGDIRLKVTSIHKIDPSS